MFKNVALGFAICYVMKKSCELEHDEGPIRNKGEAASRSPPYQK